jgi:hypothetical protein
VLLVHRHDAGQGAKGYQSGSNSHACVPASWVAVPARLQVGSWQGPDKALTGFLAYINYLRFPQVEVTTELKDAHAVVATKVARDGTHHRLQQASARMTDLHLDRRDW